MRIIITFLIGISWLAYLASIILTQITFLGDDNGENEQMVLSIQGLSGSASIVLIIAAILVAYYCGYPDSGYRRR